MAERFREKVSIQPIQTGTQAASGMMSLVDKLEGFKQGFMGVATQEWTRRSQERGLKRARETELVKKNGVTQAPEFDPTTGIGRNEAQTYNKAISSAYMASLNRDVRENITRIQAENSEDLINFNTQIEAFRNSVVKNVDPMVRRDVSSLIDDVSSSSRMIVQKAVTQKNIENSKNELNLSAEKTLNDALVSASNNDFAGAARGLIDYEKVLTDQMESGFITESEFNENKRKAYVSLTVENLIGSVRTLSQDGDFKQAVNVINNTREKVPGELSVDEHQSLITGMIAELNESISLNNKLEKESDDALKDAQVSNYGDLTIGIAQGTTDLRAITASLKNKQITPKQYDSLVSTLNSRGQGVDDYAFINQIKDDIYLIGTGETELTATDLQNAIIENMGGALTDKTGQELLNDLRMMKDKEFILNQPVVKRARDFITPSIRIVGIAGSFDSEAEQRRAMALRNFDERVLAGENPWDVADELVGKDKFEREPQPMYGSKDDLDTALIELQNAATAGQIDKATYNYQVGLINRLKQMTENIKYFNEAKKNADSGR